MLCLQRFLGAYGNIDTSFYVNHSDSHDGFVFTSTGALSYQNFELSGNGGYYDLNFSSQTDIQVNGASLLSFYQSNWILEGWLSNADFSLGGAYDGLDAIIECGNYTQCFVYCNGAHSCYGITLNCDDTSYCEVNCNTTQGIWCPLGNNYVIRMF